MRAIMAARNFLFCLIFIIVGFPICVDEDTSTRKREIVSGNTPIMLDVIDFEFSSHTWIGCFYDVFLFVTFAGLFLFISYQLRDIQRIDSESGYAVTKIQRANKDLQNVLRFYKETEEMFVHIEARSTSLKQKFGLETESGLDNQQMAISNAEICELREKWQQRQTYFARYGIDLGVSRHTSDSITAELTVAAAFLGSQIRQIGNNIEEDTLSRMDVQRDVRILNTHFGK